MNCTFSNRGDTELIVTNSVVVLNGISFLHNSVHNQEPFMPGGGIATLYSDITFQGNNIFVKNTCKGLVCRGGAIYAEKSYIKFYDYTRFINNAVNGKAHDPSSGGGIDLSISRVSVFGCVELISNSTTCVSTNGEGGGIYLAKSSMNVTGNVSFTYTTTEHGGEISLDKSTISTTGSVSLTNKLMLLNIIVVEEWI